MLVENIATPKVKRKTEREKASHKIFHQVSSSQFFPTKKL